MLDWLHNGKNFKISVAQSKMFLTLSQCTVLRVYSRFFNVLYNKWGFSDSNSFSSVPKPFSVACLFECRLSKKGEVHTWGKFSNMHSFSLHNCTLIRIPTQDSTNVQRSIGNLLLLSYQYEGGRGQVNGWPVYIYDYQIRISIFSPM